MEALRLWNLTTPQPLRQLFHLTTSTTTTNFSARLVLRCSSATTSTTEGHNHQSSSSSCSLSSSSSTSDRDVIHTIHLKKLISQHKKEKGLPLLRAPLKEGGWQSIKWLLIKAWITLFWRLNK
ncbi:lysine--tRNA ligase, chloroplastic/mitochondrial-like isoform X1 [Quercus lobata]|uniref:lysine--tRNA ligase, chloroplastic/mitochondrial-like isoform X1 n=1 Tax=Quercus lobata TaxID=97700 RepID=UPI001245A161|nr:lysine--tRNA ligase, chloroplastic/mitochondrial-like isoform X1 [Quercus lobata]